MKDRIGKVEREVQQLNVGFSKDQEENKVVFNELSKKPLAIQNPNSSELNPGRPPVTCCNCGWAGHVARLCHSAPRSNPNAAWRWSITCYNSQQTSHISRNVRQQDGSNPHQSLNTRGPQ
mgnify:CR=1 FL=1